MSRKPNPTSVLRNQFEVLEGRLLLASTPYPGPNPTPIGLIQAENFDNGGESVAFHDLTTANQGGKYRTAAVDIEACGEGGYDLSFNQPGEWLLYTVNVPTAGTYKLDIREAYNGANTSGGIVHLEVDGANVTGALTLAKTGGWQTWQTISKTGISLSAGNHVLKLAFDADGAGSTANTAYLSNVNWIQLTAPASESPYPGPGAAAVPGTLEVENFDNGGEGIAFHDLTTANQGGKYRTTAVDVEACGEGGYDLSFNQPGEWLKYMVNVATTGSYTFELRGAYGGVLTSGGVFHVECDGVDVTGSLGIAKTGGWQTWQTTTKSGIALTAGAHALKLVFDKDGGGGTTGYLGNVNWMRLSLPAGPVVPGSLDSSFGSGGIAKSSLLTVAGQMMAVQHDGKAIVAFSSASGWAMVRFTAAGALDTSFGTGGRSAIGLQSVTGMALAADDSIVVAGQSSSNYEGVVKYTAAGAIDTAFGSGGLAQVHVNFGAGEFAGPVAVDGAGKIVLAVEAETPPGDYSGVFARLSATGGYLNTIDPNNLVSEVTAAATAPDGSVVFAGSSFAHLIVDRIDTSGALTPQGTSLSSDTARSLACGLDGRIYIGASGTPNKMVCLDSSLSPVSTFGGGGTMDTGVAVFDRLSVQRDGKIVVFSRTPEGITQVKRFTPDGTQDMSFGQDSGATLLYYCADMAMARSGSVYGLGTYADGSPFVARLINDAIPAPWLTADVGSPGIAGSTTSGNGTFKIAASGADLGILSFVGGTLRSSDAFRYDYQPLIGDGQIVARVMSIDNTDANAKAGLMIRSSLSAGVPMAFVGVTASNGTILQYRTTATAVTGSTTSTGEAGMWFKLVRSGSNISGYKSGNGVTWTQIGSTLTISAMPASVLVGLVGCSHADSATGTSVFSSVSISPTPYFGLPTATPNRFEAENFDNGGEGVAWHDVDGTNQGGKYRTTGVDIETCSEGGYDLSFNQPGEWLRYTTDIGATGTYTLGLRVAYNGANTSGGTAHVEVDGVNVTGAITLPKTGGWQTWQTVTKSVSLTVGTHVLRLVFDADGAGSTTGGYLANVNWFSLA